MSKKPQDDLIRVVNVDTLDFQSLDRYVQDNGFVLNQQGLDESGWALVNENEKRLLDKIRSVGVPLGEYVGGKIYYGIKTGLNKAFVIDEETKNRLIAEDPRSAEVIKPFLAGKDVKRYQSFRQGKFLLLIPKGWTREKSGSMFNKWKWFQDTYPAVAAHLLPFREEAEKRDDKGEYWWELRACDYYNKFTVPKIFYPDIAVKNSFTADISDGFFSANTTYFIPYYSEYLLGILNSKVLNYFYASVAALLRGGYLRFFSQYIEELPIPPNNSTNSGYNDQIVTHVTRMLNLHKQLAAARLPQDKDLIQRQIDATDKAIDTLVYDLYGLTEEERKIIEESVR